jgi:hypothetical protein
MRKKLIVLGLVAVFVFAAAAPAMAHFVSRPWITSTVVLPTLKAYSKGHVYPALASTGRNFRLYLRVYQQNAVTGVYAPVGIKGCAFTKNAGGRTYWNSTFDLVNRGNIRLRAFLNYVNPVTGVQTFWGSSAYRYVHVTQTR